MRVVKRNSWLAGLATMLAAATMVGPQAQAEVTSDKSGSIVIFPKVIADGTRDTLIELTNTSNLPINVHCIYVDGHGECASSGALCTPGALSNATECLAGPNDICIARWEDLDFTIALTRQQPTIWRVSTGRTVNPLDNDTPSCSGPDCPGIDPGAIPARGPSFRGELKCVQVGPDDAVVAADALKGEATIENLANGQISRYNSINFRRGDDPNMEQGASANADLALELNNSEFPACPAGIEFTHHADGAPDEIANGLGLGSCTTSNCPVRTEITVIPCTEDFEAAVPQVMAVQIFTINEFEQGTSSSFLLECWANLDLSQIGPGFNAADGSYRKTQIRAGSSNQNFCRAGEEFTTCTNGDVCDPTNPTSCTDGSRCRYRACLSDADCGDGGLCAPPSGLLAIVEEFHNTDVVGATGTAAINVINVGSRAGRCRGSLATSCSDNSDCGPGGNCLIDAITFHGLD